ncbi:MAG TPA: extracellular solute-binding protein [Thermoflexales bacterium]|nr:extracellular solute-binding protein [Thermoflexales bacterium]HQW34007.1 extracellular solute-binding protein [Thermoflexales bacterium]HQZ22576.1 extracellular solute-binding protein [Thermoflexales bacterium]HQZ99151.1 extracellular solute-binding protein [Thermoflexales bacterium]
MSIFVKRSGRYLLQPFVLFLALTLLLSGCAAPGVSGNYIPFWHTLTGAKERALLELVDRWNANNPTGSVIVPERKDLVNLRGAISKNLAANAMPSLLLVPSTQAANLQRKDLLAPLDEYLNGSAGFTADDRADFLPFVLQAGKTGDGRTWALPFGGAARAVLMNSDWLSSLGYQNVPADWDNFGQACTRASDSRRGTECFTVSTNGEDFADWVLANGGKLISNDLSRVTLTGDVPVAAMNRLLTIVRANQVYRVNTLAQERDEFASGRALFGFDWTDTLSQYETQIKQAANFEWGIDRLPGEAGKTANQFRAPVLALMRTIPAKQAAAWQFARWLMEPAQTRFWADRTGDLPARFSALSDANTPRARAIRRIAQSAVAEPFVSGWDCAAKAMSNAFTQILDGGVLTQTLTQGQFVAQADLNSYCGP